MKHKRINIGLLVSNLADNFDNAVTKGVMAGAKEIDANLIIIPGRYLKGQYYDKERARTTYQYNTLFSYVNNHNIDVLLILLGTIGTVLSEREKKIFLDMYQDIPVILLASEKKGYSSILFDNKSGIKAGITNFVEKGCKNIGMVSGPITNDDAIERLDAYKEALAANNLKYDENLVVYGNFSEYSNEVVEDLINRNPKLDAIVFANDQMAIGGYAAIKKKGLKVGYDILTMGFDDSPASTMLIPNLTTVRADAEKIGYLGAIEAANILKDGDVKKSYVETTLVKRDSSGDFEAKLSDRFEAIKLEELLGSSIHVASTKLIDVIVGDEKDSFSDDVISSAVELAEETYKNVNQCKRNTEEAFGYIEKIISGCDSEADALNLFFKIFDALKESTSIYFHDKMHVASNLIYDYLEHVTTIISANKQVENQQINNLAFMANSLAKDMLVYGENDDRSYYTVNDKMAMVNIASSYLYVFKTPFINKNSRTWHDWQVPSKILLKSYYKEPGNICIVKEKNQEMDSTDIFNHKYMPDRQYCMVLYNVFLNEEQFGLVLCEMDHSQFFMTASLLGQLSSAYKMVYMLKLQAGIQEQLKLSLNKIKESNEVLESMSKKDELTGIYNRRGFFEITNQLIDSSESVGKKSIVVFADLDNLKTINDNFGHDEGDYAIRTAASILKESFRNSDVVARIGGDEFAVFAISDASITGETIRNRIVSICDRVNGESGKPYYVELSVGYSEFICDESIEIEKYLDMADEMLYLDKKNKRQSVEKNRK